MMIHSRQNGMEATLGSYLGGLTHLAKSDVQFPLQDVACLHFAEACLKGFRASNRWDGALTTREAVLSDFLAERFSPHRGELLDLFGKALSTKLEGTERPQLSVLDAINLKSVTDLLLNEVARNIQDSVDENESAEVSNDAKSS